MRRRICPRCNGSGDEPIDAVQAVCTLGFSIIGRLLDDEEPICNVCRGRGSWLEDD